MCRRSWISVGFGFWLGVAGLAAAKPAPADDAVEIYFQGLLDRELYRVAEDYALNRLKDDRLPPERRADVTIQLSRALAQHARLATDGSSDAIWDEAEAVVRTLLDSNPNHPRAMALQARLATIPAERGELLRWESEILPEDEALRRAAIETLREAIAGLAARIEAVTGPQKGQTSNSRDRSGLAEDLQFRLAEAHVNLARLLPVGPDRAGAFLDAAAQLDQLGRGSLDDEMVQNARLLRAMVARLQKDDGKAEAVLRGLSEATEIPPAFRDRVIAEQARHLLDQGRPDESLQLLSDRSKEPAPLTSELRAVIIDTLLATWRIAAEKQRSDLQPGLLEEAERQLALTGGIWHRWAANRIEQVRETSEFGEELAALMRAGRAAYQNGLLDEAASRYAQAADSARAKGLTDKAVELAMTGGSILLQQSRFTAAANGFADVASSFPDHPRAAEADLLKCYALGREAAQLSPETVGPYRDALKRHVDAFPGSKTAADALWMLGSLQERTGHLVDAWEAYDSIPLDHPRAEEAFLRLSVIFQRARSKTAAADEAFDSAAVEMVLRERIASFPMPPQRLSLIQAQAVTNVAHGLLDSTPPDYRFADGLLQRVEQSAAAYGREADVNKQPVAPDWISLEQRARQLRIVSLAGQERFMVAQAVLTKLGESDPESVLRILSGLGAMSTGLDELSRQRLGRLQLQAAKAIGQRRSELSADQRRLLDESTAQAYLEAGNIGEAIVLYERLWKQSPQDRRWMETVAGLYLERGSSADLQHARRIWMQIEAEEKKGSGTWFDARLKLAEVMLKQKAFADCRKLIGVTKLVYPDLGGSERRRRFDELIDQIPN